jgi:hypothetical protein
VRLVDGEERQLGPRQQRQGALLQQSLGRDIENVEVALPDARLERDHLAKFERGIEKSGFNPGLRQRLHLILHQGDERRDDDAEAGADERRDLVAQRLAAAGRHQGEGVIAGDDRGDDVGLVGAEIAVAEHVGENLARPLDTAVIRRSPRRAARHVPRVIGCPAISLARFERNPRDAKAVFNPGGCGTRGPRSFSPRSSGRRILIMPPSHCLRELGDDAEWKEDARYGPDRPQWRLASPLCPGTGARAACPRRAMRRPACESARTYDPHSMVAPVVARDPIKGCHAR